MCGQRSVATDVLVIIIIHKSLLPLTDLQNADDPCMLNIPYCIIW